MELFSWQALGTVAGAALATYLVVQYTKGPLDGLMDRATRGRGRLPTDIYAVFVGFAILLCAAAATGTRLTWETIILAFLNGFVVALTAGHMHDKVLNPPGCSGVRTHNGLHS